MRWYNILGDNEGSISHILQLGHITVGSILLTVKLFALKRGNYEPILTVKRTEWRRIIDYFGISIEADPFKVGKNKIHIFYIGYIPRPSYVNIYISRYHLGKIF